MKHLLDTSALLAHHRQEPGWETVQSVFEAVDSEPLIASLSLTELARRFRELGASDDDARKTSSEYRALASEVVAIDADIALGAFDLACRTATRLPLADALIAAAAKSRGARLVHRDAHMRGIAPELVEQLDLEPPRA